MDKNIEKSEWPAKLKRKRFNYMWVLPYIEKMQIGETIKVTLDEPFRHFPAAMWYMYRNAYGIVRAYRCKMFSKATGYSMWYVQRIQSEYERELDQTQQPEGVVDDKHI